MKYRPTECFVFSFTTVTILFLSSLPELQCCEHSPKSSFSFACQPEN